MANLLITIGLSIALTGMLVFLAIYMPRANWRHSALGRHMVYFGLAFALTIATNLLRLLWDGVVIDTFRVASVFLLAAVTWQRTFLLLKSFRRNDAE